MQNLHGHTFTTAVRRGADQCIDKSSNRGLPAPVADWNNARRHPFCAHEQRQICCSTYNIHGTPEPALIDQVGSHGCVRLANWDVEELAATVKPRVSVEFVD
ncbi:L,D-transpeptidase [Ensifer sp. LC163]|uniref:L,D-transpeptidase n=1 Tax=Ensifer sp. LC163 TaxID=1120652 RepID=UPI00237816C0|nr:L,D-transpeptidase family protein [Ensifer sp. LC163]